MSEQKGYVNCLSMRDVGVGVSACISRFNERFGWKFKLSELELNFAEAFYSHQLCEAEAIFGIVDNKGKQVIGYTRNIKRNRLEVYINKRGGGWYEVSPIHGSYFRDGKVRVRKEEVTIPNT